MKKVIKILVCLVSLAVICAFFGCSKDDENIIGGADNDTYIIVSENESTTTDDIGKSISYVLTEDEAQEKAYDELKQECDEGTYSDINNFSFHSIELKRSDEGFAAFNNGYGNTSETENFSNHAYYAVIYTETTELTGHAYICIDAVNGNVLFSGYSGD